jgi:GH24 family phage-related lysozyme (muramidase)
MGKWKGIVGRSFTPEQFKEYVAGLSWDDWRPEFIVLHNTGGLTVPGGLSAQYIRDMEHEYRDVNGWSAGPHLFVDSERIWVFTPLLTPGVHANSWNNRTVGVEMEGDYDQEAFSSGRGLAVQRNAVAVVAILSVALKIDPGIMMFHRENGETTHHCPGSNVIKADFIQAVRDYLAGEEPAAQGEQSGPPAGPADDPPPDVPAMSYRVTAGKLNIRSGPGIGYEDLGDILAGEIVTPLQFSGWLPVLLDDNSIGWLALQYLQPVSRALEESESNQVTADESVPEAGKMKTSRRGLEFIKSEEGCVLHVYQDQAGYPTIGVGHLIKAGERFTAITEDEALELLAQDAKVAEDAVNRNVKVPLTQNQFDALVSFTFNCGTGALEKSTLLKLLNQGQYDAVPGELAKWVKAGGKTLQGLVNRRRHEGELFMGA